MTRLLVLSRGMSAIVDDEDFERLQNYTYQAIVGWREGVFYAKRDAGSIVILMHREILGIETLPGHIRGDHIDGNGLNNQRHNLRVVSASFNNLNKQRVDTHNSSGSTGVYWNNQKMKWHAEIKFEGRKKHLGFYIKIEDAISARKAAEKALWKNVQNLF